jgi:hypothetical protein
MAGPHARYASRRHRPTYRDPADLILVQNRLSAWGFIFVSKLANKKANMHSSQSGNEDIDSHGKRYKNVSFHFPF